MVTLVKLSRSYDSSRRREQAERTRQGVLEAAHLLFLERGYAATTLPLVGAESGVSADSVYKAYRNKPTLLKAVLDVALAGDAAPVPVMQRDRAARIFAEPDPRRKLEIYTDGLLTTLQRSVGIQLLVRAAAGTDPELAALWAAIQGERLRGMARLAENLAGGGHLAAGVTREEAGDVLWTYNSPDLYQLLVIQRAWAADRYRRWVTDALVAALLLPGGGRTSAGKPPAES